MIPMKTDERSRLVGALRRNATRGDALVMDQRDTSFVDTEAADRLEDQEVVNAIKSVPCHY